jgi:OPA family glycerol-3-phosphate transporter-like MFS transporter
MMIGFVRRSVVDAWWPKYFVDFSTAPARPPLPHTRPTSWQRGGSRWPGSPGDSFSASPPTGDSREESAGHTLRVRRHGRVLALFGFSDMFNYRTDVRLVLPCRALVLRQRGARDDRRRGVNGFRRKKSGGDRRGHVRRYAVPCRAFVGMGVGYVTTRWGWEAWHWAPIPFALAGAWIMSRIWNVVPKGRKE